MARGVIALAVAVVVAALVAGAAAQPSQAQYDEFMAGSVGGSVVGMSITPFDADTPDGAIAPRRLCVNEDVAQTLIAPAPDRATVAYNGNVRNTGGRLLVLGAQQYVTDNVQLGAIANPSALAKFLLNAFAACSPDPLASTRVLIDTGAFPNGNDFAQWLVDYNTQAGNIMLNPIAIPESTIPFAGGSVAIVSGDHHASGHNWAAISNLVNQGKCVIVATSQGATGSTDELLAAIDGGIYASADAAASAATGGFNVPASMPTGTFHCCVDATDCNGNGVCNNDETCTCENAWTGSACDVPPLCVTSLCSGHGDCTPPPSDGTCACTGGYTGEICEIAPTQFCITPGCSGHGGCNPDNSGACLCTDGYTGLDCSGPRFCDAGGASVGCSSHGFCSTNPSDGSCVCTNGYTLDDCSGPRFCDAGGVSNGCSGNGGCSAANDGTCTCTGGYTDADCSGPRFCDFSGPSNGCSGHGQCTAQGTCLCEIGWSAADCSVNANCEDSGGFYYQGNSYTAGNCNANLFPCTQLEINGVLYPYWLIGHASSFAGVQHQDTPCLEIL